MYYYQKAKKNLKQYSCLNIGITGSFGKTSVKNYLFDILSNKYFVLKTPNSYNTPMGLSKIILKELNYSHEIFISELGATKPNDINELIQMVPVDIGIISEIGYQHLESFKTIENILSTKLEILNSTKINTLFINNDNHHLKEHIYPTSIKIIRVGKDKTSDYLIKEETYSFNNLSFTLEHNNIDYVFKTSLLGKHNIINLSLSIAVALEIGVLYEDIKETIEDIKPVKHRLELKVYEDYQVIDDSFNSNTVGFLNALKVLDQSPYKKILITPGIVEIDKDHYELLDDIIDYIIQKNIFTCFINSNSSLIFIDKLIQKDFRNYIVFNSFKEAYNYALNIKELKTILIENDLTDYYLGG